MGVFEEMKKGRPTVASLWWFRYPVATCFSLFYILCVSVCIWYINILLPKRKEKNIRLVSAAHSRLPTPRPKAASSRREGREREFGIPAQGCYILRTLISGNCVGVLVPTINAPSSACADYGLLRHRLVISATFTTQF